MNKLSIISIFLMALITSACASNALAMEGSKPLSDYSAEEVLVYRWNAMVQFYQKQILLPNSLIENNSDSVSAARWEAIVRYHLELPQTIWSGDDVYDHAAGTELESFQVPPVTTLIGAFDQAALQGLLRRLYSLGLPLISVNCLEVK